jgi:hypothetical protein
MTYKKDEIDADRELHVLRDENPRCNLCTVICIPRPIYFRRQPYCEDCMHIIELNLSEFTHFDVEKILYTFDDKKLEEFIDAYRKRNLLT